MLVAARPPVLTDATATLPCETVSASVVPTVTAPSNSVKLPRTVAMPMCLTANWTLECAASATHVPTGTELEVRVDMTGP